jgi:hypothetical protein
MAHRNCPGRRFEREIATDGVLEPPVINVTESDSEGSGDELKM